MVLAESNAILFFLAQGSQLWPESAWDQAKALQWMFFEQYSHEPNVATVRFWISIKKLSQDAPEAGLLKQKIERGYDALAVMEAHLQDNDFFVADRYTVADIALYAYTHMAEEGGFSLKPFPAIQAWLMRIAGQLKTFPEGARKAPLKPETLDHHRDGHRVATGITRRICAWMDSGRFGGLCLVCLHWCQNHLDRVAHAETVLAGHNDLSKYRLPIDSRWVPEWVPQAPSRIFSPLF